VTSTKILALVGDFAEDCRHWHQPPGRRRRLNPSVAQVTLPDQILLAVLPVLTAQPDAGIKRFTESLHFVTNLY